MIYGRSVCRVDTSDPSITLDELYEQEFGLIPDNYQAVRFCDTDKCKVHLTIKRATCSRFEIPPELQPRPCSNPHSKLDPWTDERRLEFVQSTSSFKSSATTWQDYCLDYLTSPDVPKARQISFCSRHFLERGFPCRCGYKHALRKHVEPRSNLSNSPDYDLDADIAAGTAKDCGKAITGEAFGRVPPGKDYYETEAKNSTPGKDEEEAYLDAYQEISQAFRVIKVMKLRPGGENWLHVQPE